DEVETGLEESLLEDVEGLRYQVRHFVSVLEGSLLGVEVLRDHGGRHDDQGEAGHSSPAVTRPVTEASMMPPATARLLRTEAIPPKWPTARPPARPRAMPW